MATTTATHIERRIHACWLGKAVGGTLGAPHEGKPGPLDLAFYDPVPTSLLPNDDLDLQVVWSHHLLATGARAVTPDVLAEAWQRHVVFPYDEYGITLRNHAYGLRGAARGAFDNWFAECMGGAIRSELWACVAPGDPARAAALAWADAVCDHAGDGVWAEIFLAALESAAFAESDRDTLLDGALAFLPETSRVRRAIADTRAWWAETGDWREVRSRIQARHGRRNFTDVAANLAFTILGWLAGGGDFGQAICIATNCGEDTDCTAATLGSLLGILDPDCIPERWLRPIGDTVVLSREIVNLAAPRTLDEFTEWTLRLRHQLAGDPGHLGAVAPRAPASSASSPLYIPALVANAVDALVLDRPTPPSGSEIDFQPERLPGHWIHAPLRPGAAPAVRLYSLNLRLDEPAIPAILAYSYGRTSVWLDGLAIPSDRPFTNEKNFSAPSLHRAQHGLFLPGPVEAGDHTLVIAWDRSPTDGADLVMGIGDAATRLWWPKALAQRV